MDAPANHEETSAARLLETLLANTPIKHTSGDGEHQLNPQITLALKLENNQETLILTLADRAGDAIRHHAAYAGETALEKLKEAPELLPYLAKAKAEQKENEPLKIHIDLPNGKYDDIIHALCKRQCKTEAAITNPHTQLGAVQGRDLAAATLKAIEKVLRDNAQPTL